MPPRHPLSKGPRAFHGSPEVQTWRRAKTRSASAKTRLKGQRPGPRPTTPRGGLGFIRSERSNLQHFTVWLFWFEPYPDRSCAPPPVAKPRILREWLLLIGASKTRNPRLTTMVSSGFVLVYSSEAGLRGDALGLPAARHLPPSGATVVRNLKSYESP